ncbi:MAG TPA: SCO family protein [Blastocatellia bacterium]|nr:SCO family protein [Blastocatellia bacterium]
MNSNYAKLLLLGMLMVGVTPSIISQVGGGSSAQQQELQYICPMHPDVKSKLASTCPKCGMTLKQESNSPAPTPPKSTRWGATYFPNVTLTTQDGKAVRFYDDLLRDKVVAVELIYTSCQYNCPLETARMAQLQKLLADYMGKSIFFYSITIDPKRDTPDVLKAYAERFHAGPGWLFLTGKEEDIELISKKLGLYTPPNSSDPDGHTPTLMIGNVAKGIWMKNAALDNPAFLARWIRGLVDDRESRKVEVARSYTDASPLNIDKGQYLFSTRCAACHTIGRGDKVGPDLLGVTRTRDRAWLQRFIAVPDRMLAEKDPIATALFEKYKKIPMPNVGLHDVDVATLIEYMEAQTASFREREKAAAQK